MKYYITDTTVKELDNLTRYFYIGATLTATILITLITAINILKL